MIQLAESLFLIGENEEAIELLRGHLHDEVTGSAGSAFLALALHDSGQPTPALRIALAALAPTLPLFGETVLAHAGDLRPVYIEDEDDSAEGYVIFSFWVTSDHEIDVLAGLRSQPKHPRPTDRLRYDVFHAELTEAMWDTRADRLEETVNAAIDALEGTGIEPAALAHPDVTVVAFFTFPSGAETISAEAVARLAKCNATIWIDA